MTFRAFNQRWLHPFTQALMIFGIVALCQPWNLFLHRYGLVLIIVGLVGFMITGKIGPDEAQATEGETTGVRGGGHG